MSAGSFLAELHKRKVVQVAAIYGAVAWGVTEVVVTVVQQLFLPQWLSTLAVIGFVVGFPVAMFLAWTFDITSDGIRRTKLDSGRGRASIVLSLLLVVTGTAVLFLLIRPAIELAEGGSTPAGILPNSLAVLPFGNASQVSNDSFLSEGLSDELRDQLSRVKGLRIAARSSSIAVRDLGTDARTRATKLGVVNLVEGSLNRRGKLLRVSVQLVDGSSGLVIWSDTFERGLAELPGLQQDIFEKVVQFLLPQEKVLVEPATRSADANELMLLARYYEQQVRARAEVDTDKLIKTVGLYRDATVLDPQSALAFSRLAGSLLYLGDLTAAEAPIFRALSLQPDLSEVQLTLGLYYFARGMPEANAAFRRAVELNPNNADALEYYAFGLWIQGIDENVMELYQRAVELDPLSLSRYGSLGEILGKQGRTKETLELIQRIQALFDGADAYRLISLLYELIGRVDHAIGWAIKARDAEPGNVDHVENLADLYAEIGDFDTALTLEPSPGIGLLYRLGRFEDLIEQAEDLMIEEPEDILVRYLLAFAYNATGQFESAVWILSSTGLPASVMEFPRMGADWDGLFALINASLGAGEGDVAKGLAEWFVQEDHTRHDNIDWWVETFKACALAVLGRDAEALNELNLVKRSPRLVPVSVLKYSLCFQAYSDEPVYRSVLEHFDARRAALRERLPDTLAELEVTL